VTIARGRGSKGESGHGGHGHGDRQTFRSGDGQEGEFFAVLVKREPGPTRTVTPITCAISGTSERPGSRPSGRPIRCSHSRGVDSLQQLSDQGEAEKSKFGPQIKISECRGIIPEDTNDGYDFFDLVEGSKYPPESCYCRSLASLIKHIRVPKLARLVREILDEHADLFKKMPAAKTMHHG